jgi:hypothetical protein
MQLLYMGREYPLGYPYFCGKCRDAFRRQRDLHDEAAIEQAIKRGEYVIKELEAMYMLRKYRTLKKRYYED